jgi:predicted trehalose synthase
MSHGIYDAAHDDRTLLVVRIEERIRELCAKALAAPEGEMNPILGELKTALHEHTKYLRQLATKALVGETHGETHGDRQPPVS